MSFGLPGAALLVLLSPLPVGTDRRRRRVPWVTYTLIGLNVLVYLLTGPDLHPQTGPLLLSRWGLLPGAARLPTLFTHAFLHVSFLHLFWNMAFLWLFGPHVEDALGRLPYAALYVGGIVSAGLLHMAVAVLLAGKGWSAQPLVGASGAVSAILAPFAVRFHRAHIRLIWLPGFLLPRSWGRWELRALAGLSVWLLENVVGAAKSVLVPQGGGIAYWAHLGGFAFGLVAAELTHLMGDGRQEYLLEEARNAGSRGPDRLPEAIRKYRHFLDHDPDNAAVRVELAAALARHTGQGTVADAPDGNESRIEAALEMTAAARLFRKQGHPVEAVRACAQARALSLNLLLSPREQLRLGGAALDSGDTETAAWLLCALVEQAPEAPEDEMARLKLGQLLAPTDPARSLAVLTEFLDRYPHSEWMHLARDLCAQARRTPASPEKDRTDV